MNLIFQSQIIDRLMTVYNCNKDSELASKLGITSGAVSNYRNGRREIPLTLIYKVASEKNTNLNWLLFGKQEELPELKVQMTNKLKTYHPDFAYDNYIPIKLLKDSVAAGSPLEVNDYDTDGFCLIYSDKRWLPSNPEDYTCIRVTGRSMYPILDTGDIVAIDHSQKNPYRLERKMVAFKKNGGVTIKWLKVLEDETVVGVPENKDEIDSVIVLKGEEINRGIIGKIAWWWAKR
ncbi:MAG: helix-turn-helix domain-containing protein [Desulfobacterales bacterium]|nr:helix-turn-helix domain-containing protein [Desulfobacterales bacterium]MBF0398744.1 helix-turn-helix domain-containing protein [Desulfobacterales bacterium]